jgi:hypothetical protein
MPFSGCVGESQTDSVKHGEQRNSVREEGFGCEEGYERISTFNSSAIICLKYLRIH